MEAVAEGFSALLDFLNRYGQGLSGLGTLVLAGLTFLSLRWAYEQEARRQVPGLVAEIVVEPGALGLSVANYSMYPVQIAAIWVSAKYRSWSRWRKLELVEMRRLGDKMFTLEPTEAVATPIHLRERSILDLFRHYSRVALEFEVYYAAHPKGKLTCRMLLHPPQQEGDELRIRLSDCKRT